MHAVLRALEVGGAAVVVDLVEVSQVVGLHETDGTDPGGKVQQGEGLEVRCEEGQLAGEAVRDGWQDTRRGEEGVEVHREPIVLEGCLERV